MTVLLDASALVALATNEPEAAELGEEIDRHEVRLCCAIGLWEATLAVARKRSVSARYAGEAIDELRADFEMKIVAIGENELGRAREAHGRYGKGTGHPARLNMGDCFAYACAKTNNAKLLYKGDDFSKTDLA